MLLCKECILAVGVLLGRIHIGDTITCYTCVQATGDAVMKGKNIAGLGDNCLNTVTTVCADSKYCLRYTTIYDKPGSAEQNAQRCAPKDTPKAECIDWSPYESGDLSGKKRVCYCEGDKCNGAVKGSGYPSTFLGLCVLSFLVAAFNSAKS